MSHSLYLNLFIPLAIKFAALLVGYGIFNSGTLKEDQDDFDDEEQFKKI